MNANTLRQKFLDFFRSKEHRVVPSASLIPENDPTVLFTTAGMHPLVPYLLGQKHPEGKRLTSVQKCIRTVDIEEVGDAVHHTFFEMLGNWSLGDYFKEDALAWSLEFLTSPKWLGLDKKRLAVSVFKGDKNAPFDEEAYAIWVKLGIPRKRIVKLSRKDNWWGPAGQTGPCGPDSEIFYWTPLQSPEATSAGQAPRRQDFAGQAPEVFDAGDERWVEIWNNVFMQFDKQADGACKPLQQKNIDTGMGLERTLAALNGLADDYQTELFAGVIEKIEQLSGQKYGKKLETTKAMRIAADHIKAAAFIMGDDKGVAPSNLDQGYVVRRLIRRAVRYGRSLNLTKAWTKEVARAAAEPYRNIYPELARNQDFIFAELDKEEEKFSRTLQKGLARLQRLKQVSAQDAFDLYQTYGFPLEMIQEELGKRNLQVDEKKFQQAFKQHQDVSRTAAAGRFKSGLAEHSQQVIKYHTASHLLLAALRQTLGDRVYQKGSNITAERLRLDFSHPKKLTDEQKEKVERLVNEAIQKDLSVKCEEMPLEEAKAQGAMGVFESKYGAKVKVYTIGQVSREICAGPHVKSTGQLGHFKIVKEESSSSGVRRIKAVLG